MPRYSWLDAVEKVYRISIALTLTETSQLSPTSLNFFLAYADVSASRTSSSITVRPLSDRLSVEAGALFEEIILPS